MDKEERKKIQQDAKAFIDGCVEVISPSRDKDSKIGNGTWRGNLFNSNNFGEGLGNTLGSSTKDIFEQGKILNETFKQYDNNSRYKATHDLTQRDINRSVKIKSRNQDSERGK